MTHFKPMLAHKYDEARVDWLKSVYMQPKLDGVRCVFTKDGAFSRTGKKFMNLQHLFTPKMSSMFKQNPWLVLDGELYNHDLRDDFEKIISLVRKQKPTDDDRKEARKMIQYHVYDYAFCNPNENKVDLIESDMNRYKKRMDQLVCSNMYSKHIKYVPSKRVADVAVPSIKIASDLLPILFSGKGIVCVLLNFSSNNVVRTEPSIGENVSPPEV